MTKTVKIALPIPSDRLFTYLVGDIIYEELIGKRVLVNFGKRILTGIITEISETNDDSKLKEIIEVLDEKPAFSSKMLKFTRWVAKYYYASWGETLHAALPQGMSPKNMLKISLYSDYDREYIQQIKSSAPKRAALLDIIIKKDTPLSVGYLQNELGSENISHQLQALDQAGIIHLERYVEKEIKSKTQKAVKLPDSLINDKDKLNSVLAELDEKAFKQGLFLSHVYLSTFNSREPLLLSKALEDTAVSSSTANTLKKKGLIEIFQAEIDRSQSVFEGEKLSDFNELDHMLNQEQSEALKIINQSAGKQGFDTFLVHGITGSGKTLIYLHAIKKAIDAGKNALILVPEISLTPQLTDRFEKSFPGLMSVLHSKMSDGERYDSWRKISNGNSRIVLGARSAVFAPLENIGIIIVDEEHEPSYKQDAKRPRYHGRDCAIVRGKMENCTVLLGSATPSTESMNNALSGKFKLIKLIKRGDGASYPDIDIIDMKEEKKSGAVKGNFSIRLLKEIIDRVNRKEGVILFQNRRGYSSYLECSDCADIPMCENCSVSLTYHKKIDLLRCHYCGYTVKAFKTCRACGFPEMKEVGSGTQKIEDELAEALKNMGCDAKIVRMDLDTTSKKGSHRKILSSFARGESDILLGTQMVAKGLDFSRVTLVGVINADLQLYLPDFRASERAFQLLTQVAGRSGRKDDMPGNVLIQTNHPDNMVLDYVQSGSYIDFFNKEIRERKNLWFPPFCRLVLIEFTGRDDKKTELAAEAFGSFLPGKNKYLVKFGPMRPQIYKVRNWFRHIIIIKNDKSSDPSGNILRKYFDHAFEEYGRKHSTSAVRINIDIDSYSSI